MTTKISRTIRLDSSLLLWLNHFEQQNEFGDLDETIAFCLRRAQLLENFDLVAEKLTPRALNEWRSILRFALSDCERELARRAELLLTPEQRAFAHAVRRKRAEEIANGERAFLSLEKDERELVATLATFARIDYYDFLRLRGTGKIPTATGNIPTAQEEEAPTGA